jgi:hypothetical protein
MVRKSAKSEKKLDRVFASNVLITPSFLEPVRRVPIGCLRTPLGTDPVLA